MEDCRPMWTPMAHNHKITADDPEDNTTRPEIQIEGHKVSYLSVVGSLMYAMMGTHSDIAYVTGFLDRYSAALKNCHWTMVKHILCYLQATRDMELQFDGSDVSMDMNFHGYSDADWSEDPDTSCSTSGFVFLSNRGAIAWASKCQAMVALSSTESKYIGLSNASQHLAWLRAFFSKIDHPPSDSTTFLCDNHAAIILTKEPQFRACTKHIQHKYHFVCDDLVAKGKTLVRYVPTNDMVADIMTKALGREKH